MNPPSLPRAPRLGRLLALVLTVLVVHTLFLGLLPVGVGDGWQGGARRAVQVRQIRLPPPGPMHAPVVGGVPVAQATPPALPLPRAPVPLPVAPPAAEPVVPDVPEAPGTAAGPPEPAASEPVAAGGGTAAAPDAASAAESMAPAPATAGGGVAVPVYPTRLPAAALLRYDIRRGVLGGTAELRWRPGTEGYELTMEGSAFSISIIGWRSAGVIDAAGLAPTRFTDRRRGRDVQAANFQRDKGLITYSGPAVTYPLVPGAQDRLSWMLQLPAILEADAARAEPGARTSLFVTGARGDGDVWTFAVEGIEAIDVTAGHVESAVHLHREPRKPYDTQVDVWLDPARSHLPVRVTLTVPQTGDSTEFVLRDTAVP